VSPLNFNGSDSFGYSICDTDGACDTATVTITVIPVNDPPVAVEDSASTDEDVPVAVDAAANDFDVDGNLVVSSATAISLPADGALLNNGNGTFTYMPDPNFNGVESFDYQICDTDGACDTATVTITVNPVNDPPVANDDSASTQMSMAISIRPVPQSPVVPQTVQLPTTVTERLPTRRISTSTLLTVLTTRSVTPIAPATRRQ
jgi:hypothetical protein